MYRVPCKTILFVAPIIEEEDETGGHENENEDGL